MCSIFFLRHVTNSNQPLWPFFRLWHMAWCLPKRPLSGSGSSYHQQLSNPLRKLHNISLKQWRMHPRDWGLRDKGRQKVSKKRPFSDDWYPIVSVFKKYFLQLFRFFRDRALASKNKLSFRFIIGETNLLFSIAAKRWRWERFTSYMSTNTLTENSPVSGSSLKKAEIFYGYFDLFGHTKWILERCMICMTFCFSIIT